MAYKERKLINQVLIDGSKKGRMFRGNAGKAWRGQRLRHGKKELSIPKHIINLIISWLEKFKIKFKNIQILINPRIFHGMPEGFPDTFGWESKIPCKLLMCVPNCALLSGNNGCGDTFDINKCPFKIAIFKVTECKTGKQKLTKEQQRFKDILEHQGGIYEIKTDE